MTTELFAQRILVPDPNRAPCWNDGHLKGQQYYNLKCICGRTIKVDVPSYIEHPKDENILGKDNAEKVLTHFGLQGNKSLSSGWPGFRIEQCTRCQKRFLVDVAVFEPANGWYQIVMQGVSEVAV